jgi:hypothetical protein
MLLKLPASIANKNLNNIYRNEFFERRRNVIRMERLRFSPRRERALDLENKHGAKSSERA